MSRTKFVIKNIFTNIGGQGIVLLVNFIQRSVFIYVLGKEYLGLQSFYTSILSVLSLAELGVADAIVFALYKPIAQKDEQKISDLMGYYAKAYKTIGIVIGVLGGMLTPFLEFFISGNTPTVDLKTLYLLYLFNTVISYFFAYKRSILQADQKGYICNLYQYSIQLVQALIQVGILLLTHNFFYYVILQIVFTFLINFLISVKANKEYPFLTKLKTKKLEKSDKNELTKNVKALFLHKIGGIVVNNTDTLLMSKFIGIETVGLYANYRLIITSVTNVLYQIVASFMASLGNLGAENDREKFYEIYKELNTGCFLMYAFSATCMFNLLNPFIEIWIGKDYLFDIQLVCILSINFYVLGMRQLVLITRTSLGLFWYDRYKPLVESIVNFVVSMLLLQSLGIEGIFLGTLVGYIIVDLTVEPYVLYIYGLRKPLKSFYANYISEIIVVIIINVIISLLEARISYTGILGFIYKSIICVLVCLICLVISVCKKKEFINLNTRIKSMIKFHF